MCTYIFQQTRTQNCLRGLHCKYTLSSDNIVKGIHLNVSIDTYLKVSKIMHIYVPIDIYINIPIDTYLKECTMYIDVLKRNFRHVFKRKPTSRHVVKSVKRIAHKRVLIHSNRRVPKIIYCNAL